MSDLAQTFSPPNAIKIWTDGKEIFAELPTKLGNPPYIITFPNNTMGLSKVLALLGKQRDAHGAPLISRPTQATLKRESDERTSIIQAMIARTRR